MLQKLDIFGRRPQLYFQKTIKHQTNIGGISTILLAILILGQGYYLSKDLILKQNPNTTVSEEYVENPKQFIFTPESKSVTISLQSFEYETNQFIDESVYTAKLTNQVYIMKYDGEGNKNMEINNIEVPLKVCQDSDFQVQGTEEFFKNLPVKSQLYCIDYGKAEKQISIQGDFGQDVYSTLQFDFFECQNSTSTVQCQPQEKIDKILGNAKWASYISDIVVDPKNYDNPFKNVARNLFGWVSNKAEKIIEVYFENVNIETNLGIFWDLLGQTSEIQYASQRQDINPVKRKDGKFLTVALRFQKVKETRLSRSYIDLPTVLAQLGGIIKILLVIFGLYQSKYNDTHLHKQILNSLSSQFSTHILQKRGSLNKLKTFMMSPSRTNNLQFSRSVNKIEEQQVDSVKNKIVKTTSVPQLQQQDNSTSIKKIANIKTQQQLLKQNSNSSIRNGYSFQSKQQSKSISKFYDYDQLQDKKPVLNSQSSIDILSQDNIVNGNCNSDINQNNTIYDLNQTNNNRDKQETYIQITDTSRSPIYTNRPSREMVNFQKSFVKKVNVDNDNTVIIDSEQSSYDRKEKLKQQINGLEISLNDIQNFHNEEVEQGVTYRDKIDKSQSGIKSVKFQDNSDVDNSEYLDKVSINNYQKSQQNQNSSQKMSLKSETFKYLRERVSQIQVPTLKLLFASKSKDPNDSKEIKIFKSRQKELLKQLDIVNIVKKLKEIDQLKSLLLDDNQQILLQYSIVKNEKKLSKNIDSSSLLPLLKLENSNGNGNDSQKQEISQIIKAYIAYKEIIQKEIKNETDIKIMQNLDCGLQRQFKLFLQNEQDAQYQSQYCFE